MSPIEEPPEPWQSFFAELDIHLTEEVQLHCCGGFVATQLYGVPRTTSDVDFLLVLPSVLQQLLKVAGKGSALHEKHRVYLDNVNVATRPVDYAERLVPMYEGTWVHLRLFALEAHDLALSKLERNLERDRNDVQQLVMAGYLHREILKERYYTELRPYLLSREAWHDSTLQLWLDAYLPL